MTTVYPYVVVVTKEAGSVFTGDRQLSTTIVKTFKNDKYKDFYPRRDSLVKNAEVCKVDGELQIIGEEIYFTNTGLIDKLRFGKRYQLYSQVDKKGKVWTVADLQEQIKIHTKGRLVLDDSKIKLGYSSFLDFIRLKKTFYIDTTIEVLSSFYYTYPKYIQQDKKGFFIDGYYETIFTIPFKFKTNNYRIEEF